MSAAENAKMLLAKVGDALAIPFRGVWAIICGICGFFWSVLSDNFITRRIGETYDSNKIPFFTACLILFLIALFLAPSCIISIKSGEAGVEWSRFMGGTIPDRVYGEGTHFVNPFNTMFVYNVRTQEIKHEMSALTINGLAVKVRVSIRFRPDYNFLAVLHQRIGPNYSEVIVIPEVESELRRVIGKFTPEEIFTTQGGLIEGLISGAFTQVGQNFVTLDDVVVRSIELPDAIRTAIESKLTQQQQMLEYDFRLVREQKEAQRRIIEARGVSAYNVTIAKSLTEPMLRWEGIAATKELASSPNTKIVVVGQGRNGLPVILNPEK